MRDQIHIRDLSLRTIIGVNDDERLNRQDVLISITLHTDTREASASDDLTKTVNYREITKRVIHLVEQSRFFLVERMAEEIAATCLEDDRVAMVDINVEKPGAIRFARSVGVTIQRSRVENNQ
jgi:dihydroneopterin aldolase/D-erythro-7,8-dihydroneopterin triphosphate epimerase